MAWTNSPQATLLGDISTAQAAAAAAQATADAIVVPPGAAVVRSTGWTDANSVFRSEYRPGVGLVLAPFRSTFNVSPARDITDFDAHGWTGWSESGADLAGSGLNRCYESAGVFQLYSKDSTSGSWGSTTRDAPRRGKQYIHKPGGRLYFCVDVSALPSGIGGIVCWLDALESSTNSVTIGMGGGGTSTSIRRIRPGSAVDSAASTGLGVAVAWFRVTFGDQVVVIDASPGSTRPTAESGWAYIATVDNLFTGSGLGGTAFRPRLNIACVSINASSALTGFYVRFHGWDDSEMSAAQWGATKLETSGYAITATVACDADAVISDATLRTALTAAAVSATPFDTTGWTARAKRGGAPSGAYAAFGSVSQEATTGSGLYLDLKYTSSDGIARGALRDLIIPIAGAP